MIGEYGSDRPSNPEGPRAEDARGALQDRSLSKLFRPGIWLLLILLAALIVRTIDLENNPPGLYCDEAAIGWDAFCILKTGQNQYGHRLPLLFPTIPRYQWSTDSFGPYTDYRGPLFVYSTSALMCVVGPTPLAVRLTAALYGTLAVLATYLLAARMLGKAGGLVAAGFLAITPWAVHTSRLGIEWPTIVPLVTLGSYAFLRGLDNPRWWVASGAFFGIASYGYSIARLFAPLMTLCLAIVYARYLRRSLRWALVWLATAPVLVLPMATNLSLIATRFNSISIFNPVARAQLERNLASSGKDEGAGSDEEAAPSDPAAPATSGREARSLGNPIKTALGL